MEMVFSLGLASGPNPTTLDWKHDADPLHIQTKETEMISNYLAVMAGGAAGVGFRMFISNWSADHFGQTFPWGTLLVNVSGCLIIGIFTGLTGPDGLVTTSPIIRQVVAIGVLGGFTTYSSFSLQTINLLAEGKVLYGLGNIFLTLLLCLASTWIGLAFAGALQPK